MIHTRQQSLSVPYTVESFTEDRMCLHLSAVAGMMTAYALARIFSKLFGEVDFAAIDTDRNKYPIGKGEVSSAEEKL